VQREPLDQFDGRHPVQVAANRGQPGLAVARSVRGAEGIDEEPLSLFGEQLGALKTMFLSKHFGAITH
jgi:hypothetical protein